MEAQLVETGQPLEEQRQLNLHLTHGQRCIEGLQAFPDQPLAVEPEGCAGDAGFQIHGQFGEGALVEALLEAGQLVGRQAAQRGDLFGVPFR